jgi:hypothetical protein
MSAIGTRRAGNTPVSGQPGSPLKAGAAAAITPRKRRGLCCPGSASTLILPQKSFTHYVADFWKDDSPYIRECALVKKRPLSDCFIEQDFKNAAEAYQRAFPKTSGESARRNASRLLTNADIQERMGDDSWGVRRSAQGLPSQFGEWGYVNRRC